MLWRWATFFLSGICHQFPERCLVYEGQPLPLCARCLGTFLGVWLALLVLALSGEGRPTQLPQRRVWVALGLVALAWLVDGSNSFLELLLGQAPLYPPANALRLVTGMGLGLSIGVVLYPIYHATFWRATVERPVLARAWRGVLLLGVGAGSVILLLGWPGAPWALWRSVAVLAALGMLAFTNAILIALLLGKLGAGERPWQVLPWLAAGLLLALAETGAVALVRAWWLGAA